MPIHAEKQPGYCGLFSGFFFLHESAGFEILANELISCATALPSLSKPMPFIQNLSCQPKLRPILSFPISRPAKHHQFRD